MERNATLKQYIKHERAQPLGEDRLKGYLRRSNVKFIRYSKIGVSWSLSQLVSSGGATIILWDNANNPKIGHYTCVFHEATSSDSTTGISYFDPTGYSVEKLSDVTGNNGNKLLKIFSGKDVHVNTYPFQKIRRDTQSCGRHCCNRVNFSKFNAKQFRALMYYSGMSTDDIAVLLTLSQDLSHWDQVLKDER